MNAAITTTVISVLGAGLFGMFFMLYRSLFMLFENLSDTMARGFASVDARFGRLEERVDNLTGEVHALEVRLTDKFTSEIRRLESKFTGELRAHDERLARIEAKLETDPPAEAA